MSREIEAFDMNGMEHCEAGEIYLPDFIKEYMGKLVESLLSTSATPGEYLDKIALTTIVIIVFTLIHMLIRSIVKRSISSLSKRLTLLKTLKTVFLNLTGIAILFIWIQAINALVLIALLLGGLMFFIVKGLTTNIIGYFVIKFRKYFRIGHRVEIDDVIGDVMDINFTNIELMELRNWLSSDSKTGRVVKLPNKIIFDEKVKIIGLKNTFVWQEIQYVFTFESNFEAAEKVFKETGEEYVTNTLTPVLREENPKWLDHTEAIQPVCSLQVNEAGIVMTLRYLVHYLAGTKTKTELHKEILKKLQAHPDIQFAVQDVRILE